MLADLLRAWLRGRGGEPPAPEAPEQPKQRPAPDAIEAVELHTSPWVSGSAVDAYYGPCVAHVRFRGSWEIALKLAARSLQTQAAWRGANAITTVETHIDPFEGSVRMTGVAARLRPL